jgi:hypothetical protein
MYDVAELLWQVLVTLTVTSVFLVYVVVMINVPDIMAEHGQSIVYMLETLLKHEDTQIMTRVLLAMCCLFYLTIACILLWLVAYYSRISLHTAYRLATRDSEDEKID